MGRWSRLPSLSVKVGKELVQDIRQFVIITGQQIGGFVVSQCLDTVPHAAGVVVIKFILNTLFVFALYIPDASLEFMLKFMHPRTDPAYSPRSVPSANKSQSVLSKQSRSIEVASSDHTCTVLIAGFVLHIRGL